MTRRQLRRNMLLARCELDRRELEHEWTELRHHWTAKVDQARRFTPWALIAAPVAGALLSRGLFRNKKKVAGTVSILGLAYQMRHYWPLVREIIHRTRSNN